MFQFAVNFTDQVVAAMEMKFVLILTLLICAESTFGQEVRLKIQFAFRSSCCMFKGSICTSKSCSVLRLTPFSLILALSNCVRRSFTTRKKEGTMIAGYLRGDYTGSGPTSNMANLFMWQEFVSSNILSFPSLIVENGVFSPSPKSNLIFCLHFFLSPCLETELCYLTLSRPVSLGCRLPRFTSATI